MVGVGLTITDIVFVPKQFTLAPVIVYVVVTVGLTTTEVPVNAPGSQLYDVAPDPVNVEENPEQTAVGEATAVTVGKGIIKTLTVVVPIQPDADVPLTVYVVLVTGVTTTLVPVKAPGFQVYETAPEALNVDDPPLPAHTLVGDATAVIVGSGFTKRETVSVLEQLPLLPVTVYVVAIVGLTTIADPDKAPGFHVYVDPPLAVNVAEPPIQMTVGLVTAVIVGSGFTIKEIVLLLLQMPLVPLTV